MNFKKSVHNALWGSESWEISAHPTDPSVIVGGERKGATLREVYPNFPLLFKVIDAKTRLSVQVHPNEETCKVTGGEPKTEMWCALSDGPIYAGLKKETSAADVEVTLTTDRPAFFVWVNAKGVRGEFSDNSFTLLPGRPRTLTFSPKGPVTPEAFRAAVSVTHLRETY